MANRLSFDLNPLLRPERLISAAEILADRRVIPSTKGIYGWWFNANLPNVSTVGTFEIDRSRLLYVGIAPKGTDSKSTLQKRIRSNHLGNRIASSTLRRTLAHLLKDELGLSRFLDDKNKFCMSREDETKLTGWMAEHAAVSFLECERAWDLEDDLVAGGEPVLSLNIRGSAAPSAAALSKARNTISDRRKPLSGAL